MKDFYRIEIEAKSAEATDAENGKPVTIDVDKTVTVVVTREELIDAAMDQDLLIAHENGVWLDDDECSRLYGLICEAGAKEAADFLHRLADHLLRPPAAQLRLVETLASARRLGGAA